KEGYLLIDMRASPGVTAEFVRASGLDAPIVGAGQKLVCAQRQCCACGCYINITRKDDHEWCAAHDAYLCNNCGLLRKLRHQHGGYKKRMEAVYEAAVRRERNSK